MTHAWQCGVTAGFELASVALLFLAGLPQEPTGAGLGVAGQSHPFLRQRSRLLSRCPRPHTNT